ncbi:MAG: hypothetical protein Q8O67_31920 [Deltaproteobacteria bacterium]|nr:hypothetical protein [Deltaproteobacteria bacterium]
MLILTDGCLLVLKSMLGKTVHLRRVFPFSPFGLSYCLTETLTADVRSAGRGQAIVLPRALVRECFDEDALFRANAVAFLVDLQRRMTEELLWITASAEDRVSAFLERLAQDPHPRSLCHACGRSVKSTGARFACATNEELAGFTGLAPRSVSRSVAQLNKLTGRRHATRLRDKRHIVVG